ncbi:PTS glucose transporter subunit IIA [Mycobacterium sp. MBM]|nr:PTS glucose transporter subunit IIA [Mycobacterium sp. MBM]
MTTTVIAPVPGRTVALRDVPDPVFAQGMVGYGAAIDPPREIVTAVAPVGGRLIKLMPHAFVVLTADNVGVLVHLGLDTVALDGEGFTTLLQQGEQVRAGQPVVTFDVSAVAAKGLDPVVPVVVMDEREQDNISVTAALDALIAAGDELFVANR